jgi:L-alanine-DL-glutamate epimerase-like enolase superfamily enzyme
MAVAARPAPLASDAAAVSELRVRACTVPTEAPESDGTLEWEATTIVVVEVEAGDEIGLGYTYGDRSVAAFIDSQLRPVVCGGDALAPGAAWTEMRRAIRNAGRPGVGAMAVSAVDIALWDLKAKLLGVCLADALPRVHEAAPIYGSGGFTSYVPRQLRAQLEGWMESELPRVKIKVGRDPDCDPQRLALCRKVIGAGVELMVDANGAFTPKRALARAAEYDEFGVSYFEEPVSSEDRAGLRFVREQGPPGVAIAAGEYEWDLPHLAKLGACVDVLHADVTRSAASPRCSAPTASSRRCANRSPPTARRRSAPTSAALWAASSTSSTSTTTSASSGCSSTAPSTRAGAPSNPTARGRGWAWS